MRSLGKFLNQLQSDYHDVRYLSSDPLEFVHRYTDPHDQEAVALIAALLAYGNVKQIRKSVQSALERMARISTSPKDFVKKLKTPSFRRQAHQAFDGFVHRFNMGSDIVHLYELLGKSWIKYGSLGGHFVSALDPDANSIDSALIALLSDWREWVQSLEGSPSSGLSFLLSSPQNGSCCKRWCMFLRWMGRSDSLDPGLWTRSSTLATHFPKHHFLSSHQLVIPLDTHTGRISQYLGLTARKALDWKAALEVTAALKKIDPQDPTRYDFALSRLGILDICQRSYREEICNQCQLLTVCQFAQNSSRQRSQSMPHSV